VLFSIHQFFVFFSKDSVKRLATAIMNELEKSDSESIDNQAVSAWLSKSGLLIE
jgi:hypothetical protein